MKHYEITIQLAKQTLTEKFCYVRDKADAMVMVSIFMEFEHPNEIYEISQIRELKESELNFGF